MRLFSILACTLFLNIGTVVNAQTPPIDDCPAGHELHRTLTGLDDASMLAAYTASFVGKFHRQPTMQTGSGPDDGHYWVTTFNHYGLYGDDICRAGWNLYTERALASEKRSPSDGDQTAQFVPVVPVPTPTPVPIPQPQPLPIIQMCDLSSVLAAIQAVDKDVNDGRQENRDWQASVKSVWDAYGKPFVKYVVPAAIAFISGQKIAGK